MSSENIERFVKFHNIPQYGAVARVCGGNESKAVIRTANGETFQASCTMGPYWAMEAAMKKWRASEDERLRKLRGF